MRVTITHDRSVEEVKASLDRGFDRIFGGFGNIEITNVQHEWNNDVLTFSLTARAGFLNVPLKGLITVEPKLVIVDLDLPAFVNNFIPEQKVAAAVEQQIKGLLA